MNCPELNLQVHVQVCAGLVSIVNASVTEGNPHFQSPIIRRIPDHSHRKQKDLPSFQKVYLRMYLVVGLLYCFLASR